MFAKTFGVGVGGIGFISLNQSELENATALKNKHAPPPPQYFCYTHNTSSTK
jgi:hypothetical protein